MQLVIEVVSDGKWLQLRYLEQRIFKNNLFLVSIQSKSRCCNYVVKFETPSVLPFIMYFKKITCFFGSLVTNFAHKNFKYSANIFEWTHFCYTWTIFCCVWFNNCFAHQEALGSFSEIGPESFSVGAAVSKEPKSCRSGASKSNFKV